MPPAKDMIPADEVEKLVAQRIQEEVARQLAVLMPAASAQPPGHEQGWAEALAMAIASIGDQEIGKRRVPPEEVKKRAAAFDRLNALIDQTYKNGKPPQYLVRREMYLGERRIPPFSQDPATKRAVPTEIGWWDIPNQYMEPLNDEARAIFAVFLEWIGDSKRTVNGLRFTAGGLVVRSGGVPVEGGRDSQAASAVGRDRYAPVVRRGDQTQEITTRILGTLMPPARQMVG